MIVTVSARIARPKTVRIMVTYFGITSMAIAGRPKKSNS